MPLDPKVIRDIYGDQDPLINPFPTAKEYKPEQMAEGLKLGRAKGVDALVAADNLPQLKDEQAQDHWDNIVKQSPNLAKQMQNPVFAAVAQDDTENLSAIDRLIQGSKNMAKQRQEAERLGTGSSFMALPSEVSKPYHRLLPNPDGSLNQVIGYEDTLKAPDANNDWLLGIGSKLAQVPEQIRQGLRIAGSDFLSNLMDMTGVQSDAIKQYQKASGRANYEDPNFTGKSAEGTVYGAVNSAIQSLPPVVAGIATRNPGAAYGMIAAQMAPITYADTRARGGSGMESLTNAGLQTGAEILGEMIPMGYVVNRFGKQGAGEFLAGFLGRELPTELATEITQSALDTAIANPNATWGDFYKSIPDTVAQTALATLMTGGALHTAHKVAIAYAPQEQAAQDAVQHRETLTQIDQLASASLLRARDPETFKQFIASAIEDGPVQDVYVDAKKIMESGVADQLAQVSPAVQSQLAEADATGGTVRIPLEEYTANIAGTPLSQALIDNVKLDPNGMTFAESTQFQETYQEEFNKQVAQATEAQQGDENFKASANEVKNLLKEQLNTLGHTSPSVNDTYSTMASSYYAIRAAQMGISPSELYSMHPLNITGERMTGSLDQANVQIETPEFKNWFGDSKVVDAEGKPRVLYHGTTGEFNAFDPAMSDSQAKTGAPQGTFFFTDTPAIAESYTVDYAGEWTTTYKDGGKILPSYVSLKNPKVIDAKFDHWDEIKYKGNFVTINDIAADVKAQGKHDGVIVRNVKDYGKRINGVSGGGDTIIAFDPTQIKSAVGNNGNFNPNDPNILNQNNRGAYSPTENTIALLKNADLSTFLHELGHAFLSMDAQLVESILAKETITPEEQQVLDDVHTVFNWFGIEGDLKAQLALWNAQSVDEQRANHEKFAEGFEAYLFEGNAPSLELQAIFQRFRAWLANVYRNLTQYLAKAGETLTPEVRAVFDRMLATTEQIKTANQARSMAPLFQSADEASMTPEQFSQYQQDNTLASQDAISELEAKSLRDMTWTSRLKERTVAKFNKEATAIRKEVRKQVEAEVDLEPVYSAMRFLKRGETTGQNGEEIKVTEGHRLSIAGLEALYPEKTLGDKPDWKKLGYGGFGMLSEDGLHPDMVADMFGFASGDDLVRTLLSAEPRNAVVEAVTDQRMLENHGELSSPEAISKAADAAIHNDVRTRVIATELAGLQKAVGSAQALSRMAKAYAQTVVGKTKVRDLRPNKFAADAARAGKEADKALRKGNREEAVTQKRNQLVNHATTKAAYEAQTEVRKVQQLFRKIVTAKVDNLKNTHNMDLVNAARAILSDYGIGTRGQSAKDYIELVKAYDPELYAALEPDIVQAQQNAKEIKELTIDELRALRDQVDSLWYLARREKQVEIDGKMVDRDLVVNALSERLDELGVPESVPGQTHAVTETEKAKRILQSFRASLRRVESWVSRMDSGITRGVFRRYLFNPISEAADAYRVDSVETIGKFRDALKEVSPTLTPGRIAAPELNYTFGFSKGDAGMAELVHAILHTGNESNKRKLLLGRGWATELEDKSLDTRQWDMFINRMISEGRLTEAHFDFAQNVWDLLEETKPIAQKTHREVFGRYFAEVTADSFTNQFGTYRGGYVPAITDTFEVQDAAINQALDDVNAGNAYMFPATSRGFTKSRVEYNRPLALDLRLLPSHIDKVLLFAHMERHVRDVQRILKRSQGKLNHYDPVAYTDMLLPWLNRAAKQVVQTPSAGTAGKSLDKFFATVRSRAGMSTMFANLTNALQQMTGFSITLLKVQPTHLRQAMAAFIKSPSEMANAAAALSPFMSERLGHETFTLRSEIDDMLLNPSKYEQTKNWTQKHAYFLQSFFQNTVDIVSWTAAYNQALTKGETDTDAVRFANSVVRETQGSLQPEDISRFESGSAFIRMFTQFASYFNMQANVLGTEFAVVSQEMGLKKGAGKAFYIMLVGFLAPVWLSEAIVQGMRGGGGDGDDEYLDEWLSFIFGAPLRNATAMVPIIGPIANRAAAGFTPQQYDDRMATAPAISAIESAANSPSSVYKAIVDDGRAKPAIKDTLSLLTMLTGVPLTPLGKPLGYMADVGQGKVEPTSVVDAVRGAVTGYASADSKR